MVAALDALTGREPDAEALAAALHAIPAAELPDALRLYARKYGPAAVPLLQRCLAGPSGWAVAAAAALGTVTAPEAAAALAAAEAAAPSKAVRTAVRRALYRLRQAGIPPPALVSAPRVTPAPPTLGQAWVSAIDGTGSRGVWLVLEGPLGARTLLAVVVNDTAGILDFTSGPIAKRRLAERLGAVRAESPLPWVPAPPGWARHLLVQAAARHETTGSPVPAELSRWLAVLPAPDSEPRPPIHDRLPVDPAGDQETLEDSSELLTLPELAGWFLDPSSVQADALEVLQARESRLVVSDHVKEERRAAVIDRVIEAHFDAPAGLEARQRWRERLEEDAFVLLETGRPEAARRALAVARALADPERSARRVPFVRALVERSLEVAGEVALGRLPANQVSRRPPPRSASGR